MISFGHIGFVCIGAYGTAMLTANVRLKSLNLTGLPDFIRLETYDIVTAAAFGGLLSAVVALLIGIALMRLSGIAASIATFAFLAIVQTVYLNWDNVTGGAGLDRAHPALCRHVGGAGLGGGHDDRGLVVPALEIWACRSRPAARTRWRPRPPAWTSSANG